MGPPQIIEVNCRTISSLCTLNLFTELSVPDDFGARPDIFFPCDLQMFSPFPRHNCKPMGPQIAMVKPSAQISRKKNT